MRITDPNRADVAPAQAVENSPADAPSHVRQSPEGATKAAPDQANLSSVAGRLSEMLGVDSGRTERIRQLREVVANGTYQVDSAAVSHAMVEESLSSKPGDPQS